MAVERSRTATPVRDDTHGRTMGRWAMWLILTVLTTAMAGFVAAGLYLHTGQPAWPPPEIDEPGRGLAVLALALAMGTGVTAHRATMQLRAGHERASTATLAASVAVATATIAALVRHLIEVGFRWDEHAYASIHWLMYVLPITFLVIAALMLAAVFVQRLVGVVDPTRMLELDASLLYVWWTVATVFVCLAVAHLLPDPAAGDAVATAVGGPLRGGG